MDRCDCATPGSYRLVSVCSELRKNHDEIFYLDFVKTEGLFLYLGRKRITILLTIGGEPPMTLGHRLLAKIADNIKGLHILSLSAVIMSDMTRL